jgi:hypothetical protein
VQLRSLSVVSPSALCQFLRPTLAHLAVLINFGIAQDFHPASTSASSFANLFGVVHTTIYVGYRHFAPDIRCADLIAAMACSGGVSVAAAPGTFAMHKLAAEPIDVVISGARVRF